MCLNFKKKGRRKAAYYFRFHIPTFDFLIPVMFRFEWPVLRNAEVVGLGTG